MPIKKERKQVGEVIHFFKIVKPGSTGLPMTERTWRRGGIHWTSSPEPLLNKVEFLDDYSFIRVSFAGTPDD
jgi:hypothetical protein